MADVARAAGSSPSHLAHLFSDILVPLNDTPDGWHALEQALVLASKEISRVRLSSLRCFFFAIRLRRFLMTEPTM